MEKCNLILLALILVFVLSACSSNNFGKIKSGEIIGMEYTPMDIKPRPIATGKTVIMIPVKRPESWKIKIKNEAGETAWVEVSKEYYESVSIGEYYEGES